MRRQWLEHILIFVFPLLALSFLLPRAPRGRAGRPVRLPDCGVPSCCWDCEVEAVRAARAVTPEDPVRPDSRGRLQITAHGEAQKLKRTKIKPKRRVAAGVRVGLWLAEVAELALRSLHNE